MSDFEKNYQEKHKNLSMIKSAIRIFACGVAIVVINHMLIVGVGIALAGLIIAEFLGIAEEMI